MVNNHGAIFNILDADQLESNQFIPTRSKLLDRQLVELTQSTIDKMQPLMFLGNDVSQSIQKNQYELILHGITPCGSKTTIVITGIFPHVDVETNPNIELAAQVAKLKTTLDMRDIDFKSIETVQGKNFMKYHDEQRQYMRVRFNTLKHRLEFIKLCLEEKINTFSNDRSTYYRVVARNHNLNLSGWNMITGYTQVWSGQYKSKFCLTIDVKDICSFEPDSQIDTQSGYPSQVFKYERMILASFDIEMIPANLGRFPDASKCPKDSIFMICVTFHYAKKTESLLSVCLTLKENEPLDDVVTIVCGDEACLLLAFSKLFDMVQPDFITEFNGGGFDWRNIIVKAEYCGIVSAFLRNMSIAHMQPWEIRPNMLSRYFQEKEIKIGGATAPSICKTLKMQGYVNFDTLVIFKQLEDKVDSHKLNECLKRCNLGSKDDMDIKVMFDIYLHGTAAEMKMVAHYCFIDTFKLQALLLKKNVIQDRREVSVLSMTSIYDCFYYANGSKIRNILMSVGDKRGYMFDTTYKPTIEDPKAKFTGAVVVPPAKGIVRPMLTYAEFVKEKGLSIGQSDLDAGYQYINHNYDQIIDRSLDVTEVPKQLSTYIDYMMTTETHYPVSGLDFSSLYPSLIMTYNISPETLITDREYAQQMKAKGHTLKHVTFDFLNRKFDAWFIQHENVEARYGLCPAILIELFAKRAALKKVMKPFGKRMEHMEMDMKSYTNIDDYPHMSEYNEVCFDYAYLDAKQKALKIFMNTFYGEMGNFLSFICTVETAASVTAMGRYNLMLAKAYVENTIQMKVYYGDSVVGDTPIMIKRVINGIESKELIPIEELGAVYEQYNDGKECIDYSNADLYVMTEAGYSKINKLIRHKTDKQLYRVTTHIGSVIVTEDHSLLDSNKQKIKPSECIVGTSLLHWNVDNIEQPIGAYDGPSSYISTSQIVAQRKYLEMLDRGYNMAIEYKSSAYHVLVRSDEGQVSNQIKSIEPLGSCDGYVYDLETESHHFAAGVGQMVVHNTDSLYVACDKSHFSEYDRKYFTGRTTKLEYCTSLVAKTFELIEIANKQVNDRLAADNGTKFLKMAYEEVLFPVVFVSKKKYFGIAHEESINFYPNKVFVRGLETIKRGTSPVMKDVCNQIVRDIVNIDTTCDMLTLINHGIKRFFATKWDVEHFIKTAVYRPDKQNVSVRKMIERYEAELYQNIPEPNVRFKYILCKKYLWTYNAKGNQTVLSIGERMELFERVLAENIPVDLEYYFNTEITGQMARFIASHDEFDTIDRSTIDQTLTEKERYTKIETTMFNNAKKFIKSLAAQYSNPYQNKSHLFKQTYKVVADAIRSKNPRTKKVTSIYPSNVRRVTHLLDGCADDPSIAYMRGKLEEYIQSKYKLSVSINNLDMEELFTYVKANDLFQFLKDCTDQWIANVVHHIRIKYNYDRICEEALDIDTPSDLFDRKDLDNILADESVYVGLTDSHASIILDMISVIISKYT